MDPLIAEQVARLAGHVPAELEALVAISSPSGDHEGAEAAVALCIALLPDGWTTERVPCSTDGFAPDLIARLQGTGERRLMLLGHLDTVISHEAHVPLSRRDGKLHGPGTADMKGGDALALAVAKALSTTPDRFAELAILFVCDEEWRTRPFHHVPRFAGYDACLCFEAGERAPQGGEGVIVRRKGAGTLRVRAAGRASHSGSAPQDGRNALLALSRAAIQIGELSDPTGPDQLTVVPTIMHAGGAFNVVPAAGELVFDMRSRDTESFERVRDAVPEELDEVQLSAALERVWPAMHSEAAVTDLLQRASQRLGRPIVPRARGGASDASHFAATIPLTVDGLGPRGGGAHTPEEFVHEATLRERLEVALAVALSALEA
ncbi:MAG TPA: M20/M25/M40 family metallo-hydrolase [Solirubrobacteraceae bacterium]|nr:M20/M25/M40 family metallo-hydrolase [Solirubrobacteraceae bacterium]